MAREDGSSAVPAVLWRGSQEILSHHCPVLEKPSFRRLWLRAPLSQSQWDAWLYLLKSEEMLRHLEMEKPRGQQLCSLAPVYMADCKWKVRRSKGSGGICWEKTWFTRSSWEKFQGLGGKWVHTVLPHGSIFSSSKTSGISVWTIGAEQLSLRGNYPCAAPCPVLVL